MTELLGCPFCGDDNANVIRPANGARPYVLCLSCTSAGPQKEEQEATEGWNRRSALLPDVSGMAEPVKLGVMPSHGKASFNELAAAVAEAVVGSRDHEFEFEHENLFIGHQIVPTINFNSLNRIVTAFVNGSSAPPVSDLREENRWQPIETAPRDRTPILLGYEGWLHPVVGFYAITLGCWVEHGTKDPKVNMATKWMPLPDLHAALNPEGK